MFTKVRSMVESWYESSARSLVRPTGEPGARGCCDRRRLAAHSHFPAKCARRARRNSPSPLSPVWPRVGLWICHLVDDSGPPRDRAACDRTRFSDCRNRGFTCAAPLPTRAPYDGYRLGSDTRRARPSTQFQVSIGKRVREHAFSLAFGSVSKLRKDLQTPVGFSVSLQPHGMVEIRPAHSTWRTSRK